MSQRFFQPSPYSLDDWLKAIGGGKTPWRESLDEDGCKLVVHQKNDPPYRCKPEGGPWYFSGLEPVDVGEGAFLLSAPSIIWNVQGFTNLHCTPEQAAKIELSQQSRLRFGQRLLLATSS